MRVFQAETLQDHAYNELVSLLRSGGIIAFPTDTAYGLGADPFNEAAICRIFEIKRRPEMRPILLIVDSVAMAECVSNPPDVFYPLVMRFWPGPVTLIVPSKASLPMKLTAGTNTIGIRWPLASCATTLVRHFEKPITATSANRSGMPSAITANEVCNQLGESIDALIDGGVLPTRSGSTVLDLTVDPPVVLREGPVTFQSLHELLNGRIRRQVT